MINRRPKLTLMGSAASPDEAAAVIAAIEQFMRDTAPAVAPPEPRISGWLQAARAEAVDRDPLSGGTRGR